MHAPDPADAAGTSLPSPIVVEYVHTRDLALRANAAVRLAVRPWDRAAVYVAFGVLFLFFAWERWHAHRAVPAFMLILCAVLLFTLPLLRRWLIVSRHAQLPSANQTIRWSITADGLHAKTPTTDSRVAWKGILKALETGSAHLSPVTKQQAGEAPRDSSESRGGFVLFTHPQIGHWLPKRAFSGGEAACERLRALIEQHGIKFKRS